MLNEGAYVVCLGESDELLDSERVVAVPVRVLLNRVRKTTLARLIARQTEPRVKLH